MTLRAWILLAVLLPGQLRAQSPPIVIDGRMDDWIDAPVLASGPDLDLPVNLQSLRLAHDPMFLFVQIGVYRPANLQALRAGTLIVLFDNADTPGSSLDQGHGRLAIDYSPPRADTWNGPRYGARIRHGPEHGGEDVFPWRILSAPTHSARNFEIAIPRWALEERVGEGPIRVRVIHRDDDASQRHGLPAVEYRLDPATARPAPRPVAMVDPPAGRGDRFRVFALNVADQQFLRRSQRLAAQIRALAPDVLMFDEVPETVSDQHLRDLLAAAFGPGSSAWQVVIGESGGRQRGVIASRFPLEPLDPFFPIRYPVRTVNYVRTDGTRRMTDDLTRMDIEGMPAVGAAVEVAGRILHFVTFDLQCCGFDGSPEDRFRELQADALRQALSRAGRADGVVIAGDANLVGSSRPLMRLKAGGDPTGSDLAIADPRRLDGRSNATYGFRGPFPEGQLDFMLYSPSRLRVINAIVFDTAETPQSWLDRHGLAADTSAWISDHRPMVVDFQLESDSVPLEAGAR